VTTFGWLYGTPDVKICVGCGCGFVKGAKPLADSPIQPRPGECRECYEDREDDYYDQSTAERIKSKLKIESALN
jgi:hypothetical protein